ncbi:uncharacterized protein LOC110733514 [Chenopodium quinoa]|uniref:uncharacterized protein LOC110733514 n=1 Tax=Chenopodium quinoa TaxID=63459 RepID=UPI000B77B2A8|nr:uncharacterized protein LOC110733514 [Chenopodium quinoa]
MGAGRKTESVPLQSKPPPQHTINQNPWSARRLPKKDLVAVIFGCKHATFNECVIKQLFGLPSAHIQYVQHVTPGMPLFLFNYSDRKLHGIFEAISPGQLNINPYAWTLNGEDETPFPAQVRVKVRIPCRPLTEEQYKPILANNYSNYEPNHFWFELDKVQTNKLISLFSASPVSKSVAVPRTTAKWGTLFKQAISPMVHQEADNLGNGKDKQRKEAAADQDVAMRQGNINTSSEGKSWSSLFKPQSDSTSKKEEEDSNSEGFSNMSEDEASPAMTESVCIDEAPPVMSGAICVDEAPPVMSEAICVDEAPLMTGVPQFDEAPNVSEVTYVNETSILSEVNYFIEEISSEMNTDYHTGVNKLIQAIAEMKAFQLDQTRRIQSLEQDLIETKKKVYELENFRGLGMSLSSHSCGHVEDLQFQRTSQDSCQSILLAGGFSGSSWLRDLDLYLPSEDVMQSLEPMNTIRPYASVVKHENALYILGGGYGTSWYDTVESYNLEKDQWMSCPSLNKKKGSLAGVSFFEKIYAIGGGNASDCFSEVELLDLNVGKWITTRSMAQERFGPAAAQLNGVLYVVGGYDGREYLRSMERFDPRAQSWTKLKSMNTRRGCHSLTVLNEKLYAIGGYDGAQMVPTVEVFEPRVGSWTMLEPMKYARGYMGCVTLGNTIYAIGGMEENEEILDTAECYSEGKGWQLTDLKAVGKRCFFSAVAV